MAIDKITINGARCEYVDRPAAFLPVSVTGSLEVPLYNSDSPQEFTVGYYERDGMYYTEYTNIYNVIDIKEAAGVALNVRDKSGSFVSSSLSNAETCIFYASLNAQRRVVLTAESNSSLAFVSYPGISHPLSYTVIDYTDDTVTLRTYGGATYANLQAERSVIAQQSITTGSNNNYIVTPAISQAVLKMSIPLSGSFKRYNYFAMYAEPKPGIALQPVLREQATSFTTVLTAQTYLL